MQIERGSFNTKLGIIAATAGSSVGLGNIWRFPYETGQHGGAAFLLIYIVCVIALGMPVMLSEFYIGRKTQRNAAGAFDVLKAHKFWKIIGFIGIIGAFLILGFYSVVAGWTIEYIYDSVANNLADQTASQLTISFNQFISDPIRPLLWVVIFLLCTFGITLGGVKNGIEKASNVLMPILFVLIILMCVRSLMLPGAKQGLEFLFKPDFSKITGEVLLSAMGQAFFSLSVGMGTLITYSSYFSKETNLLKTTAVVATLDTVVAILAGIFIFPAVFTFGIEPTEGPYLVFITLPNVFNQMMGGYFFSIFFFFLLTIAAVTSTISLSEVITAYFHEEFGISRRKAVIWLFFLVSLLAIGCSLSVSRINTFTLFGMNLFDLFSFISSNILLPLGGMLISIFVGWYVDKSVLKAELTNEGSIQFKLFTVYVFLLKYVAPIGISLIFLNQLGLINIF